MIDEIWKPIPGYEGYYEVSTFGRVKSIARKAWNGHAWHMLPEKILQPHSDHGYLRVNLCKNGIRKIKRVHSLVLLTFVGPRPSKMDSRHFPDQNGANNYVINLSYCTRKTNSEDKIINGTYGKLSADKVHQIFHATGTKAEIAKRFGISPEQVKNIKQGKNWKHLNLTGTSSLEVDDKSF
jgi:hypothetical protein